MTQFIISYCFIVKPSEILIVIRGVNKLDLLWAPVAIQEGGVLTIYAIEPVSQTEKKLNG